MRSLSNADVEFHRSVNSAGSKVVSLNSDDNQMLTLAFIYSVDYGERVTGNLINDPTGKPVGEVTHKSLRTFKVKMEDSSILVEL